MSRMDAWLTARATPETAEMMNYNFPKKGVLKK